MNTVCVDFLFLFSIDNLRMIRTGDVSLYGN